MSYVTSQICSQLYLPQNWPNTKASEAMEHEKMVYGLGCAQIANDFSMPKFNSHCKN